MDQSLKGPIWSCEPSVSRAAARVSVARKRREQICLSQSEGQVTRGSRLEAAARMAEAPARSRSQPGLSGKNVFPMSCGTCRMAPGGERRKSAGWTESCLISVSSRT